MCARATFIVIVIVSLNLSSCSMPQDLSEAGGGSKDAAGRQKPLPNAKTNAELLVGSWIEINRERRRVDPRDDCVSTYSLDNKYSLDHSGPAIHSQFITGTYELKDDLIKHTLDNGFYCEMTILSITNDELVLLVHVPEGTYMPPRDIKTYFYRRISPQ